MNEEVVVCIPALPLIDLRDDPSSEQVPAVSCSSSLLLSLLVVAGHNYF